LLYDLNKTYPGIKGRKNKKRFKSTMTYDILRLIPVSFNKRRSAHIISPKRGDRVINSSGMVGTFVGIDPTGQVWIALDEYKVQFPFDKQVEIFDLCWRENVFFKNN